MVPWEMLSRRAISLFDNPSDTRRIISRSRSVSTESTFSARTPFRSSLVRPSSERRQEAAAIRYLPEGFYQDFGLHILRNDAARTGRRRCNEFTLFDRCREKDHPCGKILGVRGGKDLQPGLAARCRESRREASNSLRYSSCRHCKTPRCRSHDVLRTGKLDPVK